MPRGVDRSYFKSSISQLEALFDRAQSDLVILRALDHELGYRKTDRATKLQSRVATRVATLSVKQVNAAVSGGSSIGLPAASTAAVIAFPNAPIRDQPSPQPQEKVAVSATTPPPTDLDDLPSFPTPKSTNEPTAILAAWTALEALSPQTYRRPEDLAAGDRRCVADLSAGRAPWGKGERSRPKKQLYYQVILGSIPMGRATEDLVKAFGDDEERSQRAREKAPIGAVLVDKNGIVAAENGIAVSSFAWALPLALKLKLGALGAWPKIEPQIIEKLEGIIRRVDRDGKPVPLDLATIDKAHCWLVVQFGLPAHLIEPPTFASTITSRRRTRPRPYCSIHSSWAISRVVQPSSARTLLRLACAVTSVLNVRRKPSIC